MSELTITAEQHSSRFAFIDTARGICIAMVVMMHSALGVGLAMDGTGFVHQIVAFAKPFRMPDFFLIVGLLAAPSLRLPLRSFIDRKVLHFAYFYGLWLLIILAVKASELALLSPAAFVKAYASGLVEPFSTLWFIHLLPFFFLTLRATRNVSPAVMLFVATALHLMAASALSPNPYAMESQLTGSTLVNAYLLYLIYFLLGHYFRDRIFGLAKRVAARPFLALFGLFCWALEEGMGVRTGLADVPGLSLSYAIFGALAVVVFATIMEQSGLFGWLAFCGRNSLTIYLSFVIPMAASRILIIRSGLIDDVGIVSALVTAIAISASLAAGLAAKGTPLGFLFTRPGWARLKERADPAFERVAAE